MGAGKRGMSLQDHGATPARDSESRLFDFYQPAETFGDDPFYRSLSWQRLRHEAIRRAHGTCYCCNRAEHEGATLHVEHIKPRSRYPELSGDILNLRVVCADCGCLLGRETFDS